MFVLILLGFVFTLVALFLLVPIELELKFSSVGRSTFSVRVGWLFGRLWKDIFGETKISTDKLYHADEVRADEVLSQKITSDNKIRIREVLHILRIEGFFQNFERLLRGLTYAFQVKFLRAHLKVGFADPADTGQFFGFIWPSIILLEELHSLEARIEPSFQNEIFEGCVIGALRIWPFKTMYPLFKFLFSKPTIKATRTFLEFRREKGMK